MEDSEAYLAHYGVKGMRWGVRHDRPYKPSFDERLKEKRLRNAKKGNEKSARVMANVWNKFKESYKDHPKAMTALLGVTALGTVGLVAFNAMFDNTLYTYHNAVFREPFKWL
jgi:hypothetical protein